MSKLFQYLLVTVVTMWCFGCTSQRTSMQQEPVFHLAMLGPVEQSVEESSPAYFQLGAGDTLGQAVFVQYVAYIRAELEQQYAAHPPLALRMH